MENLSRLQTASWRTVKIPIFSQGDVYQATFPNSINWCMSVETTRPLNHTKHKCSYIIKKWTYHTHTHTLIFFLTHSLLYEPGSWMDAAYLTRWWRYIRPVWTPTWRTSFSVQWIPQLTSRHEQRSMHKLRKSMTWLTRLRAGQFVLLA